MGLLVVAGASALGAGELVVRWLAPQDAQLQSRGMFVRDRAAGYRLASDYTGWESNRVEYRVAVRTDALGMRVAAGARPPAAGRARVLVLGDSFVFGQGVEAQDAWPAVLERALADSGDSVAVLNAGVPGYSNLDEVAWLRAYGLSQRPRTVVLGVFLGNDIQDNGTPALRRLSFVSVPPPRWSTAPGRWLYEHSELYDLLRGYAGRRGPAPPVDGMGAATARAVRPYRVLDDSARRAELAGTAAAVAEFDSLVRAARVEPLAVLIPDAGVVERWRQASVLRGVPPQVAVDFEYPNKVFDSLFAAHGIPCHDLTPAIRAAAAAGEQLYFRRDRHLNTRGNRLVGTLVAALLRRRG